jgi:hypothetical protein
VMVGTWEGASIDLSQQMLLVYRDKGVFYHCHSSHICRIPTEAANKEIKLRAAKGRAQQ